ncbi:MAG: hypothetical protein ACT4OP_05770 [Actinomycetota bacterium]
MTEPELGSPTDEAAVAITRKRRWPWVVAALGTLAVLVVAAIVGSGLTYRGGFTRLVEVTKAAETDRVWGDFFMAQDCLLDAVLEAGDPDLAYAEALTVISETDRLARHVDTSLGEFGAFSTLGIHAPLTQARAAISAHYEVWAEHLAVAGPILGPLATGPEDLVTTIESWFDELVKAQDPIERTYLAAEEAFTAAARTDQARGMVDQLFTPSDVVCSRAAV